MIAFRLGARTARALRWLEGTPAVRQGCPCGEMRQRDLYVTALSVEETLVTEELQEWLLMSGMHDCLTGIDGLYNPLLLGAVNDTEGLAASAMDFAHGMWLDPLLDSGDGFVAVVSESVFAAADFDCSEFPHISKVEDLPTGFAECQAFAVPGCFERLWLCPAVCAISMLLDA